jgi:hypothetical protein
VVPWREYGRYGSVGIELIVSMGLGYYAGRALDARVGGQGWITLLGFLFGVSVGFRSIFAAARHMQRDVERQERQARGEDPWTRPPKGDEDDRGDPPI